MQVAGSLLLVLIIDQAIYASSDYRNRLIVVGAMPSGSSSKLLGPTAWKPTFENYLTETVGKKYDPHLVFSLFPLISTAAAYEMVESGKVDFMFLNPSLYSCLESENEGMASIDYFIPHINLLLSINSHGHCNSEKQSRRRRIQFLWRYFLRAFGQRHQQDIGHERESDRCLINLEHGIRTNAMAGDANAWN
jgi:hypothetical protein